MFPAGCVALVNGSIEGCFSCAELRRLDIWSVMSANHSLQSLQ